MSGWQGDEIFQSPWKWTGIPLRIAVLQTAFNVHRHTQGVALGCRMNAPLALGRGFAASLEPGRRITAPWVLAGLRNHCVFVIHCFFHLAK